MFIFSQEKCRKFDCVVRLGSLDQNRVPVERAGKPKSHSRVVLAGRTKNNIIQLVVNQGVLLVAFFLFRAKLVM